MKIYLYRFVLVAWCLLALIIGIWVLKVLFNQDSNSLSYLVLIMPCVIVTMVISFIFTGTINPKKVYELLKL